MTGGGSRAGATRRAGQRKKSFGRRVDAQRWLDQLRADQHRRQYISPSSTRAVVGDLATAWAGDLSHLEPSTRQRYRSIVRTHILPTWGTWSCGAITHSDVSHWIDELSTAGLQPGTVRQVHRVLSLILDVAVLDGRMSRNPAGRVRLPRARRTEPRSSVHERSPTSSPEPDQTGWPRRKLVERAGSLRGLDDRAASCPGGGRPRVPGVVALAGLEQRARPRARCATVVRAS